MEKLKFRIKDNGTIRSYLEIENDNEVIVEKIEDENLDYKKLDSINIYVVKKGDTLWNIAKKFKTTVGFIARTNGIENENQIQVGQKLYIPRYSKITV